MALNGVAENKKNWFSATWKELRCGGGVTLSGRGLLSCEGISARWPGVALMARSGDERLPGFSFVMLNDARWVKERVPNAILEKQAAWELEYQKKLQPQDRTAYMVRGVALLKIPSN